jgi:hypothetical protein
MATSPSFAVTPRIGSVALSGSADTSYTAPTNIVTVITGVAAGTRVAEVVVQMTATVSSATMVRLWLYDGSTYYLWDEVAIAAATGAQSVKQTRVSTSYTNLILPSASWSLRATVHTVNAGIVTALGADL